MCKQCDSPVVAWEGMADPAATDTAGVSVAAGDDEVTAHHGYVSDKSRYLARLRRIEGQVRGLQRMVEKEEYCIDILTQVSALRSALKGVGLALLEDHMGHCVMNAAKSSEEEADEKLAEVAAAIARFTK